jgi:ElaB/YqjD/DUF883 family membrane-anchored ribosome-binding protein
VQQKLRTPASITGAGRLHRDRAISHFYSIRKNIMSTTSNQLGKQANDVTEDIRKMGQTVRDATKEKLEQVSDTAAEYYEQGRDKIQDVACACKQFACERPMSTVLIALGVGWLLGRFWKHR